VVTSQSCLHDMINVECSVNNYYNDNNNNMSAGLDISKVYQAIICSTGQNL